MYNIAIIFANDKDSYYFEFQSCNLFDKSETDLFLIVSHPLGTIALLDYRDMVYYITYMDLDILECREIFHHCLNLYCDSLHVYGGSDLNFEIACQKPFKENLTIHYNEDD
jgi:hypothetical protein